jgi:pilus assembly protein FimV
MDFDPFPQAPLVPEPTAAAASEPDMDLGLAPELKLPEFESTGSMSVAMGTETASALMDKSGMLEFDLGSLSLDLDPPPKKVEDGVDAFLENTSISPPDNPLETKLALADEFVSIGDDDGARALIEEVIAEATGDLRSKAQAALAKLS